MVFRFAGDRRLRHFNDLSIQKMTFQFDVT